MESPPAVFPVLGRLSGENGTRTSGCEQFQPLISSGAPRSQSKNEILFFVVHNAVFPITTQILLKVCAKISDVLRINILPRHSDNALTVEALVEFRSVYDAVKVMANLDGADIYDNCCTLDVTFANPDIRSPLEVERNDDESWDYRFHHQPVVADGRRKTLLPEEGAKRSRSPHHYRDDLTHDDVIKRSRRQLPQQQHVSIQQARYGFFDVRGRGRRGGGPGSYPRFNPYQSYRHPVMDQGGMMPRGNVVMIYDLDPRMTPQRVFNLLCLYGDVLRVKFLLTKLGCAMVEMADNEGVLRVIDILNGCEVFGKKITIRTSRQEAVRGGEGDSNPVACLVNGAPAFNDFTMSRNQRFGRNPAVARKNRIVAPSKVLHFFNVPSAVINSSEKMMRLVVLHRDAAAPRPTPLGVSFFPGSLDKVINSGLIEFQSVSDGVDALVTCNNCVIEQQGETKHFSMKLCFSTFTKIPTTSPARQQQQQQPQQQNVPLQQQQ